MPLILQHSGHSRTVVGFEKHSNGNINLLIFDPSRFVLHFQVSIIHSTRLNRAPTKPIRQAALAGLHGPTSAAFSSHKHALSPAKIVGHILHPRQNDRGNMTSPKKRRAQASSLESDRTVKRVKGSLQDSNADAIVIDDDGDAIRDASLRSSCSGQAHKLDPVKTLNFFRVNPKKIQLVYELAYPFPKNMLLIMRLGIMTNIRFYISLSTIL